MKTPVECLEDAVSAAVRSLLPDLEGGIDPLIRPAAEERYGDFQTSTALALARNARRPPRDLAAALLEHLDLEDVCEQPEVSGPGFINFRIRPSYLETSLAEIQGDERLGIPRVERPQRVVVDFSSPNLAKEMHIGHLRTTIIGETICRLLELAGHDVLRLNHVGDWGTPFGMLLEHVRSESPEVLAEPERLRIGDLQEFYRRAKERFDSEPGFAARARKRVVDLQAGDAETLTLWRAFRQESLRHADAIYRRLGVRLIDRGESFYNPALPGVVEELQHAGIATEDQGAICLFPPGFTGQDGRPQPMIVRKSDGGYNYATTDLAALRQRIREEKADRIIYVTDVRQSDHFKMLFAAAQMAGWTDEHHQLEHVGYGMILGPDRRPFKTRSGEVVSLAGVLDEAVSRAAAVTATSQERQQNLSPEQRAEIARRVGIGSVIYSDLSHNPSSDYVFDWDVMLSLEGNTAPYMLYAYARIRSIGQRAGVDLDNLPPAPLFLQHSSERALALKLLQFRDVVERVTRELRPNELTDYLYSLSRAFSTLYDRQQGVRVIDAETEELRLSRMHLCSLTARTLRLGLGLLGIEVLEQM